MINFLCIAQAILSNLELWQEFDVKNIPQHGKYIDLSILEKRIDLKKINCVNTWNLKKEHGN